MSGTILGNMIVYDIQYVVALLSDYISASKSFRDVV
jgi:hypothetical protein